MPGTQEGIKICEVSPSSQRGSERGESCLRTDPAECRGHNVLVGQTPERRLADLGLRSRTGCFFINTLAESVDQTAVYCKASQHQGRGTEMSKTLSPPSYEPTVCWGGNNRTGGQRTQHVWGQKTDRHSIRSGEARGGLWKNLYERASPVTEG